MGTVIEHVTSRSETFGLEGDAELVYHVVNEWSPIQVKLDVLAASPTEYHQLVRGPMTLTPMGANIWNVRVKYQSIETKVRMTIDTHCEKIKMMKSLETIGNHQVRDMATLGSAGPDFGRLINVGKDRIDGVEVYAPGFFKLVLTYTSKWSTFASSYVATVMNMGATVNQDAVILTYKNQSLLIERGDLLFVGAAFSDTSDEGCEITFTFEGRLREENITVGERDGVTVAATTGDTTSGNPEITTIPDTSALRAGLMVTGAGIPAGAVIASVDSVNQITLNKNATATAIGVILTFGNPALSKEGHWYMWLKTAKVRDANVGIEVDTPTSAHIERVYEYADFARLEVFDIVNNFQDDFEEQQEDDLEADGDEEDVFGDFAIGGGLI